MAYGRLSVMRGKMSKAQSHRAQYDEQDRSNGQKGYFLRRMGVVVAVELVKKEPSEQEKAETESREPVTHGEILGKIFTVCHGVCIRHTT